MVCGRGAYIKKKQVDVFSNKIFLLRKMYYMQYLIVYNLGKYHCDKI